MPIRKPAQSPVARWRESVVLFLQRGQTTIPPVLQIMSDNIETLATKIIAADRKLKKDGKILEGMKKDLLNKLQDDNIGGIDVKEGKITVCTRTSKNYGDTIKNMEANIKAEKTRLDYLGEYIITSVTHFLRID